MTELTTTQLNEIQFLNGTVSSEYISDEKDDLIDQYIEQVEYFSQGDLVDCLNASPLFNKNNTVKYTFGGNDDNDIYIDGHYNHVINTNLACYLNDWLCTQSVSVIKAELARIQ